MKKTVQKIYEKLHNISFLHKRRLYVVLTIVFSVLLLADIGMARMMPDISARGDFENMQMSGSFADTDSTPDDSESSGDTDGAGDDSENSGDTDGTDESGDTDSAMRGGGRGDSDTEDAGGDSDRMIADSSGDKEAVDSDLDSSNAEAADDDSDSPDTEAADNDSDSSGFDMQGTPDSGSQTPPSDMSDGEMPDFDSEDFNGTGSGGDFDFEASDDGTDSSADEETGSYPDMSGFADAQTGNASSALSVLQAIRSHWLLILIILAILDAGSIFMLLRLSRQEKERIAAQEKALREEAAKTGDIHIARPVKKESRHSHYLWIIAVIVIVLLVVMVRIFTRQTVSSAAETEATVYSGTAELGDISTVLPGTGTLEEEDAYELSLPDEVEITKWYVSDGDSVEEGDVLASVDQVSVMTAIATVQSSMTSLDEALEDCEDDAVSGTITAAADGRVIAIYAESGTDVVDTMYENEALMLLSLDGYMAVSIDTSADISAGDSVNVTLSDGTVVSGKVESMASTTAVITISDNGPDLGDLVSVETEDGTYVGEGTLYIHSELKVTGFTGIVSSISVSEGSSVSSGDTLLTLTDTDYTGQYELLLEQRSELESQMETLFQLYEDGYIYASESGVISGLSDSDSDDDSSSDDSSTDSSDDSSTDSSDDNSTDSSDDSSSDYADATGYTDSASNDSSASGSSGYSIQNLSFGSGASGSVPCQTTGSGRIVQSAEESAADGENAQITALSSTISESGDDTDSVTTWIGVVSEITSETAELTSLTGSDSVSLDLDTSVEVTIYADGSLETGSVSDVAEGDILILSYDSDATLSQIVCISMSGSSHTEDSDSSSETTDLSTDSSGSSDSQTGTSGSGGTFGSGDASGSQNSSQDVSGTVTDMSGGSQDSSVGSSMNDDSSAMSGSTDTDSTEASDAATEALEEEISGTYGVSETTWLSITPQDTMTLTITVDEMDILSIEVGQEATVTLDAFPGQSFDGEVTSIDESGTNSGGSSKYTAEVTISREEGMLAGMNASAVITLDTSEDVLTIPEAALVEQDNTVYVYTTYDESSDTLGGLTEVTTGISDGENVEILSGLEEGEEYWYSYLDVVNYSSASSSSGSSTGSGSALESLFGGGGGMGGGR